MAKRTGLTGIEPSEMSVPKMDRVSVTFALMLDAFLFEEAGNSIVLTCEHCGVSICKVDDGDTMRVLFNTALAHTC